MCEHSRVWLQPNSSDRRCGKEASSRAPNSDPCDGWATRRARPHFSLLSLMLAPIFLRPWDRASLKRCVLNKMRV